MQRPILTLGKPRAPISGTFTPPADLRPAIEALTDKGRAYLEKRCEGRDVTHTDIAKAADYERG